MVWFQCEDCGENLKKPKLPNHFRICSATKLSCIDCGVTFGQQSVQAHTECITEAVRSLCNTKATSKQTLLLHADGKKHRAKARALQASKQQQVQKEEPAPASNPSTGNTWIENKHVEEQKVQDRLTVDSATTNTETENGKLPSKKKRKVDGSGNDCTGNKIGDDTSYEVSNGESQVERRKAEDGKSQLKKAKYSVLKEDKVEEDNKKKIKWKKLIKSVLKSNGVLKMKKLKRLVLNSVQESGMTEEDETKLSNILEQKINSSSQFEVHNKHVHLVAKD